MKFRLKEIYVDDKKFVVKFQPFEDFASSTTKLVEDIVQVDLPSSGSVMDGTVSCRRFANIVEDSPAFKETEKSHEALDLINKILSVYKNKLFYFESQLGKIKKSKVTKKDLDKLEKLVNILKSSQQKFIDKETLEDKEEARIYVIIYLLSVENLIRVRQYGIYNNNSFYESGSAQNRYMYEPIGSAPNFKIQDLSITLNYYNGR
ncbi:uncharacterized protein OCT59_030122 [Rhizophagus irregularis]|uniref:uncharacterized protein n=1 Tax=Rhizophagus irregularis TaxID=588596 RepID=UPI00332FDE00|nr:hypothetical protein OCT59_030122 [Rhizophagus irregularis]